MATLSSVALLLVFSCILVIEVIGQQQVSAYPSSTVLPGSEIGASSHHPKMSCYVCSTMDYENPADNLCRKMPQPHHKRTSHIMYPQQNPGHHYIQSASTTTTTTTTDPMEPADSVSRNPDQDSDHSTKHTDNSSPISASSPSTGGPINVSPNSNDNQQTNTTDGVGETQMNSSLSALHSTTTASPSSAMLPHYVRQPPPSNFIRSRPCNNGENFCSIVSVVRLEFVNDNSIPRFWALERNCSKSCNTGCMLIGERVRLRVCSQCCSEPNCNVYSAASAKINYSPRAPILILFIATIVIKSIFVFELRVQPEL